MSGVRHFCPFGCSVVFCTSRPTGLDKLNVPTLPQWGRSCAQQLASLLWWFLTKLPPHETPSVPSEKTHTNCPIQRRKTNKGDLKLSKYFKRIYTDSLVFFVRNTGEICLVKRCLFWQSCCSYRRSRREWGKTKVGSKHESFQKGNGEMLRISIIIISCNNWLELIGNLAWNR